MTKVIEKGEIHFFYRAKIDAEEVSGLDDLQRFFLALVPDEKDLARLFVIGRKMMPKIVSGESDPNERNWLMLSMVDSPKNVGRALHPLRYETETRGTRETPQAVPAGSGRYALVELDDATQLAYRLSAPGKPGEAQEALNIQSEARYVLSVRNPSLDVPGFPDASPAYPSALAEKFADERWLGIIDPRLLDYKDAQCVLIGARDDLSSLDINLDGQVDPFSTFGLKADEWPDDCLKQGNFVLSHNAAEPVSSEGDRSKGGKRGGSEAAKTDSVAGVTSALKGISFPADQGDLVRQAERNEASEAIIKLLEKFPEETFNTMADVSKAVGKVR